MTQQEREKYQFSGSRMSRRSFIAFVGSTLFLTACGDKQPVPTPTSTTASFIGPRPETTLSPTFVQLTPD